MIFKRKIYQQLLDWKHQYQGKRALLIEGARRVGKSTILRQFAKNEYKSFIMIDFDEEGDEIKELFNNGFRNLDIFFQRLSVFYQIPLYERQTLIIFDEIQKFPRAHEAMKYLVKDGRYDFIETGSLITLKLMSSNITIPSEVKNISMYPMDFEEFLWAIGDNLTFAFLREHFVKKMPLGNSMHKKMMELFRTYLCVGGMPQAIEQYVKDKTNLSKVDEVKRDIIKLYEDDLLRYDSIYRTFTHQIYSFIPSFLSNKNKIFKYSKIKKGGKYTQYMHSIDGIKKSMTANICVNVSDPSIGLSLSAKAEEFKIYNADTGLLISQILANHNLTSTNLYKQIIFDKLSINNGMIFENAVSQALISSGHNLFFCVFKKIYNNISKKYELDFISEKDGKIIPIEVKSSSYKQHHSIDAFIEKYKDKNVSNSYIIYSKDLYCEKNIIYLPIYMTYFI